MAGLLANSPGPRRLVVLGGALLALSGCSERATHALGLTRDAPDEFRVTSIVARKALAHSKPICFW